MAPIPDNNPLTEMMERFDNPIWDVGKLHVDLGVDVVRALFTAKGDPTKLRYLLTEIGVRNFDLPMRTVGLLAKPFATKMAKAQSEQLAALYQKPPQ